MVSSYSPQVGGVETHVRRLAEGCAEIGDHVSVLTHQVDDSSIDEWIEGVRVRRFPLTVHSRAYPLSWSLFRYLRSHAADFDLIHVHSYHTVVGHAAHGCDLPLVFTPHYHGTGHTASGIVLHRLYRPAGARLFRTADAIICVSEAERGLVIKDFPFVSGKLATIPQRHGSATSRARRGLSQSGPPGGAHQRSLGAIQETLTSLSRLSTHCHLRQSSSLWATDPTAGAWRSGPRNGGSGWPVLFTGRIPGTALRQWFAQANVITSASDHEAFGITLADGLAAGVRMVASDIPAHTALAQLAGPDAPVTLVDPRHTKGFTNSLAAALRAGRIRVGSLKLPSWAEVIADTRELYSRVLWQGHPDDRGVP